MQTESAHFPATPIASKMGVAIGIGMLAGMEREWSNKDVGIRTLHSRHLIGRHAIHLHALHMSHAAHSDIGHCANGIWIHGRDLCRHTRSRRQGTARISTARLRLRQDGACDFLARLNDNVVGFSEADSKLIHGHGLYTISVGRVHQTLRVTPAMESGLTDHIWSLEELVGLLDARKTEAAA